MGNMRNYFRAAMFLSSSAQKYGQTRCQLSFWCLLGAFESAEGKYKSNFNQKLVTKKFTFLILGKFFVLIYLLKSFKKVS
jgi:hypothetical protein